MTKINLIKKYRDNIKLNIDDKEFSEDREESDKNLKSSETQESKDEAMDKRLRKRMNKNFQ